MDPQVDPYAYIFMARNPDGSVTRTAQLPDVPPASDPDLPVLTKDVPINQFTNTFARIYLPRSVFDQPNTTKLPLLIDFHGGGFVLGIPSSAFFQGFCNAISAGVPAVIVSIGYRLAPEHRLPAAYDDAVEALHWLRTLNDDWLTKYADFSRCYLSGDSAGANIAFHVALRIAGDVESLKPLELNGLILHHPFFGGMNSTGSEMRLAKDKVLPPCVSDVMWELSLPVGADRDHEYCNPMVAINKKPELLDEVKKLGWKVLVAGCDGDPLIDRQTEFFKLLEQKGVQVVGHFEEGGCHGQEVLDPEKAKSFSAVIKQFITTTRSES